MTDEIGQGYFKGEVPELIRRLNRTYDDAFQWAQRKAQKEHVDVFGQDIATGEAYWRLRMGGSYSNDLKLSERSMESFLFILFAPHPNWEQQVIAKNREEMQRVRDIMDQLRNRRRSEPGDALDSK